jgi:superfamily II DNA or RNA helicase
MVVLPDVATARAIADYLNAENPGSSRCIYGELGDEEKYDIFEDFKVNKFQIITSVMMLTKGFDDAGVVCVFNCRRTKSKRLYTQILGRGTRTLKGTLDGLDHATPEERRQAIAQSAKPFMVMVNMVGVSEKTRDITCVDILGKVETEGDPELLERAKELEESGLDPDEALEQAEEDMENISELLNFRDEAGAAAADALDEAYARRQQEIREAVEIEAAVEVTYTDGIQARPMAKSNPASAKMLDFLRKQVPPDDLSRLNDAAIHELGKKLVMRMRAGLCSYKQGKILLRNGFPKSSLETMTRQEASMHIDAIFKRNR